jgi:hypothetical protein
MCNAHASRVDASKLLLAWVQHHGLLMVLDRQTALSLLVGSRGATAMGDGLHSATLSRILLGFLSGALSVLVIQMGAAAILHAVGILPNAPYSMAPTHPFGVPQALSSAFWGGLWGIVMVPVLSSAQGEAGYWLTALLFGGLIVGGVAVLIVGPLKGRPIAANGDLSVLALIFILHAIFGLGTAFFHRALGVLVGHRRVPH